MNYIIIKKQYYLKYNKELFFSRYFKQLLFIDKKNKKLYIKIYLNFKKINIKIIF